MFKFEKSENLPYTRTVAFGLSTFLLRISHSAFLHPFHCTLIKYLKTYLFLVVVHGRYLELTGRSDPEHVITDQSQWVAKLGRWVASREMGG
jgi:hypothetical protein